jgi:hypothetical protein
MITNSLNNLPTEPDQTKTYVYNPTKDDFTWPYAGQDYTLPSRKIVDFPKYLALHLAKHLAAKLAAEDGGVGSKYDANYKRHMEEVMVKI